MAENDCFRDVILTANSCGSLKRLLRVEVRLGLPNNLEKLMQSIQRLLKDCISELEARIQLPLHAQLLNYFMSKFFLGEREY